MYDNYILYYSYNKIMINYIKSFFYRYIKKVTNNNEQSNDIQININKFNIKLILN